MSLRNIYEKYHDRVQFLSIYIREAHPVDGWWMGGGLFGFLLKLKGSKAAFDIYDPKTIEERRSVAWQCESSLMYGMRTYVDDMGDTVNKAYAALPTRLYLVGLDGRVVYAGGLGPWDFRPAKLRDAIENYLSRVDVEAEASQMVT